MKLSIILSSLLILILAGCTIKLEDSGEVSMGLEHRIVLKHVATGSGQESISSIDGKPLVEHIIDLRENDEESVPVDEFGVSDTIEPILSEESIE